MEIPKLPIADVLGHYGIHVPPNRRGWVKISCPVHSEDRPSATVNVELGKVNCFSCGFKGDGLDLIMHKEALDLRSAIAFAESILGIEGLGLSQPADGAGRPRPRRLSDGGERPQPGSDRALSAGRRARPRRLRSEDG